VRRLEEIRGSDWCGARKISDQRIEIPSEYYYVNVNANVSISAKRWYKVMEVRRDELLAAMKKLQHKQWIRSAKEDHRC
jgi:hypothetical protein